MTSTSSPQAGELTQKLTRRQKQDAINLSKSRAIDSDTAFRLFGWIQGEALRETKTGEFISVGKSFAAFMRSYEREIRMLPLAPKI